VPGSALAWPGFIIITHLGVGPLEKSLLNTYFYTRTLPVSIDHHFFKILSSALERCVCKSPGCQVGVAGNRLQTNQVVLVGGVIG